MTMIKLLLLCGAGLVLLQGGVAQQDCNSQVKSFRQCAADLGTFKKTVPDPSNIKERIDKCLTDNGCKPRNTVFPPGFITSGDFNKMGLSNERTEMALPADSAQPAAEDDHAQCFKDFIKASRKVVQDCIQKQVPDFTLPEPDETEAPTGGEDVVASFGGMRRKRDESLPMNSGGSLFGSAMPNGMISGMPNGMMSAMPNGMPNAMRNGMMSGMPKNMPNGIGSGMSNGIGKVSNNLGNAFQNVVSKVGSGLGQNGGKSGFSGSNLMESGPGGFSHCGFDGPQRGGMMEAWNIWMDLKDPEVCDSNEKDTAASDCIQGVFDEEFKKVTSEGSPFARLRKEMKEKCEGMAKCRSMISDECKDQAKKAKAALGSCKNEVWKAVTGSDSLKKFRDCVDAKKSAGGGQATAKNRLYTISYFTQKAPYLLADIIDDRETPDLCSGRIARPKPEVWLSGNKGGIDKEKIISSLNNATRSIANKVTELLGQKPKLAVAQPAVAQPRA